jgi:putative spermidine/putrescine transport system permease protein
MWLLAPAAMILIFLLALPYANILIISIRPLSADGAYGRGFTAANYLSVLTDVQDWREIGATLKIGLITTALALLLGFPLAWDLARNPGRHQGFRKSIALSPLLVGIVVRSYGWTILLGNNGVINRVARALGLTRSIIPLMYNEFGVIVALTHVFLPIMILPILDALQALDPALEQAARSLGSKPHTVFTRIVLPLSLPGIQSGCVMVFVMSISAYVTPMLLGGLRVTTMPMTVVNTLIDAFRWPLGAAEALVLTLCGGLIVFAFLRLTPMRWTR